MTADSTPPGTGLSIDQALQLAAGHVQAGRLAEGELLCQKVLELDPDNAQALHLLGVVAHLAGKQGVALALIEKALRCQPDHAQAHYNLGVVLSVLRRPEAALAAYRQAVALDPANATALGNLGNIALELDLHEEALAAYDAVLGRHPQDANFALARGITLYGMRRFEAALTAFTYALALTPADPRMHWEISQLHLMLGDFAAGWDAYESRFGVAQAHVWCYPYPYPRWQGEPLAGKTLLLHGEQGLGDEIMYASIYPELIAQARQVIICCQPHLVELFRASFPGVRVEAQLRADADAWTRRTADWLAGAPAVDYQIPFGSLARLRRRRAEDFPAHAGYLRAAAAKMQAWAAQLAQVQGLRVGICWAANPAIEDAVAARRSRKKSLTLQQLEPLLGVAQAGFVSLQTWEAAAQVSAAIPATRARILDASGGLADFSDTAALVMNLDLVITVDTSVAHLAGALGKPVWLLLPWHADWRWHAAGNRSEWYPQARLYRQSAPGDWAPVVEQMRGDLETLAQATVQARGPTLNAEMTA
ncbi:MAG TPA: tetratricopeptide repeat protein [Burkholderiales bacterium]|jgi:Flp pilus assembly protein TadD|nr:tetratricopeptide repeat protein [Burkholderiales bacterium]